MRTEHNARITFCTLCKAELLRMKFGRSLALQCVHSTARLENLSLWWAGAVSRRSQRRTIHPKPLTGVAKIDFRNKLGDIKVFDLIFDLVEIWGQLIDLVLFWTKIFDSKFCLFKEHTFEHLEKYNLYFIFLRIKISQLFMWKKVNFEVRLAV